jgi:molybdopterin synthase catalytic subunit/molybdopterin converting factor small subunit
MIKIRIKFFAKIKEDIGHSKITLCLKNPHKVEDIIKIISKDFGVEILERKSYMYAKNLEYCSMETILDNNDELAIIPPVSGGQQESNIDENFQINITNKKLEPKSYVKDSFSPKNGSEVIFFGITRDHNLGKKVSKLFYESYKEMAKIEINKIIETIRSKWEINSLKIIYRTGIVLPSELSMVLIVTSSHRKESYEASQFFVDQLKKTVPIWKKEFFEDGTVWINDKIIE